DDLVTGTHHRMHDVEDRLARARGHRHFRVRIRRPAVAAPGDARDRLAQRGNAHHRRVLVVAIAHRAPERFDQPRRDLEVREALPQVDRLVFGGQLRHHREDRGPDLGQLGFRGAGSCMVHCCASCRLPRVYEAWARDAMKRGARGWLGTMAPRAAVAAKPTAMPDASHAKPSLIAVRGLSFARNEAPVFGPLDFAVESGEALLVQGGNGAGKTTLLRVHAGLLPAGSGSVVTDARPADPGPCA